MISAPRYSDGAAHFDMGEHTLRIPMSLHAKNRQRLVDRLRLLVTQGSLAEGSVVWLQGGSEVSRDTADTCYEFRQESYFHWAFGVLEADWYGSIEVGSGRATLYCPRLPEAYNVIMGRIIPTEDFKQRYCVDNVQYVDEMGAHFKQLNPSVLLKLVGVNSDSGLLALGARHDDVSPKAFKMDTEVLFAEMAELRVVKTPEEIAVLEYATEVSSAAHCAVMKHIRPGMREYQLESVFHHNAYYSGGCRHQAYTSICGGGVSGSVLHYGHAGAPNDCLIRDGDICLFDMGAEYYCYASDVTCSFPANGKFSEDQKMIYEAVLAANLAVFDAAKPGVFWTDMHQLSQRVLLQKLKEGGLLTGSVDEMMEAHLGAVFYPHGLGHLIGLDVHDVGGYLPYCPPRNTGNPSLKRLRTARPLMENMTLTIEPGCYFINALLDAALADPVQSKFLVAEEIERFRGFGGVRIEDDVLITADGVKNLTKVPRTVEAIEALMAEGRKETVEFPQQKGSHPSQK